MHSFFIEALGNGLRIVRRRTDDSVWFLQYEAKKGVKREDENVKGWEKYNGREFSSPHEKLFEETQPSHTLKRDVAENGYLACDMFHASERNEQDLFVVNKRTSCESERALRFCWVV